MGHAMYQHACVYYVFILYKCTVYVYWSRFDYTFELEVIEIALVSYENPQNAISSDIWEKDLNLTLMDTAELGNGTLFSDKHIAAAQMLLEKSSKGLNQQF